MNAQYDVIVIGSGCVGGACAWALCRRGIRTLVLDAGPMVDPQDAAPDASLGANLRRVWRALVSKNQRIQSTHPGYWKYSSRLFVNDEEHPYSAPEDQPFVWVRSRNYGGRSLTWGGLTLRFSEAELDDAVHDGEKVWPVSYAELAPFYDELERLMEIHGSTEGIPQLPDGVFLPPRELSPAERHLKARVEAEWPDRRVIVGRGVTDHGTRDRWCPKTSPGSTLAAAQATELLDIRPNAIVSRILMDSDGTRARAVEVIDRVTGQVTEIAARVVVLGASTLESVRILFNSESARHPQGLGNSSGLLGRYIMDKPFASVSLEMDMEDTGRFAYSAADSMVIPRYRNVGAGRESFAGGFGIWGGIQRKDQQSEHPGNKRPASGKVRGFLLAYGEHLPRADNRAELNTDAKDRWGVPTVRVSVTWGDNDRAMMGRMQQDLNDIVQVAGGTVLALEDPEGGGPVARIAGAVQRHIASAVGTPGWFIHEVGGCRMGTSPKRSVVNPYCQLWDAPNVVVADGACWPATGWQNPTLTMMAIAARACDHIAGEMLRRNV